MNEGQPSCQRGSEGESTIPRARTGKAGRGDVGYPSGLVFVSDNAAGKPRVVSRNAFGEVKRSFQNSLT